MQPNDSISLLFVKKGCGRSGEKAIPENLYESAVLLIHFF
jgi:hypothetical protein